MDYILILFHIERFWPLRLIWKCPKCKATGSLSHKVAGTERRVLVTCEGNASNAK